MALFGLALLLVLAPLGWRYRPMSESERRLVGIWHVGDEGDRVQVSLTRGRRIVLGTGASKTLGNWRSSDDKLYISWNQPFPRSWAELPPYLVQFVSRDHGLNIGPFDIEFEGTTRVHLRSQAPGASELTEEILDRVP